jgi:hypothetical protein
MLSFRIRGLAAHQFSHLFSMSQTELGCHSALRLTADSDGYPCRISLTDAVPGESVILVNYCHHQTTSPFRASFAIYVREGERTYDAVDEVPQQLRRRLLSLRAYDSAGMLRAADVVAGTELETALPGLLQGRISYVHAHFA